MNAQAVDGRRDETLWFMNSLVIVRRPSASGADGLSITEHWMPAGDAPPTHMHHDEDEIFQVLEGRIRFRVGDSEQVAGPGDTLVGPKGVPHAFKVESAEGARMLTIAGAGFETMIRSVSRPAQTDARPEPAAPSPEFIERLVREAARNRIDILGPPLG